MEEQEILNQQFPKLYCRSKRGVEVWSIAVDGTTIRITHGMLDHQMVVTERKILQGKNIGKANETSPQQQCQIEALAEWTEKRQRKGYLSLKDIGYKYEGAGLCQDLTTKALVLLDVAVQALPLQKQSSEGTLLPMKAKPFFKDSKGTKIPSIKFPCLGQPKINGIRTTAQWKDGKVLFSSKQGLTYDLLYHLEEVFTREDFFDEAGNSIVYDGELYIHGYILANIVSAVRTFTIETPLVEFHCFDCINGEIQIDRIRLIKEKLKDKKGVVIVTTVQIKNAAVALIYRDQCIAKGFEGAIFRNSKAKYQVGTRTSDMVKYKERKSSEFVLVDIVDSDKQPGLGIFILKNDLNDELFKCTPQGDHMYRSNIFHNKHLHIGKKVTVEYYERTEAPKELPFHSVGIAIRDYE